MATNHKPHIDKAHLHHLLRQMIRIRRFEERCAQLYTEEKIRGFLHLYIGEEAIAVGIMQVLKPEDNVLATYREHGHALARGLNMNKVMAELFGKVTGSSRGRGGSMHIFDREHRFYGGNAIVAGALPLAVGLALADKMQHKNRVTVCFFGEGAVAEGEFHESLNLAKLWQLPILFVCENNGYAMGTTLKKSESEQHIYKKAQSYGLTAQPVNGMNVIDVESAASQYYQAIQSGAGPCLLECHTYRFKGHSMFDPQLYRSNEEIKGWQDKGPIVKLQEWLQVNNELSSDELKLIETEVTQEIDAAVEFAEQSAFEDESDLCKAIYAESAL
jgi:pyruvate dehydrogenase E1 component alpha subunit